VQRLEKQCQFLTSWRPKALLGVNIRVMFVDVELKASDDLFLGIQAPPTMAVANYGYCCSYYNCNVIVEKEK